MNHSGYVVGFKLCEIKLEQLYSNCLRNVGRLVFYTGSRQSPTATALTRIMCAGTRKDHAMLS